jgi:hypothetical protein
MNAAIRAFESECPAGCSVRPQANPIYTLITLDGWPRAVHYEFRDRAGGHELYVEFHIEDPMYLQVKGALKTLVAEIGGINGFKLDYFESRPWPHRKKWPSASIAVPKDPDGATAASTMRGLIRATCEQLGLALKQCSA